jgi:heptosyltransferase-2
VGIFGPSDWRLTAPRGVPHRIVRHPVECSPCLLSECKWKGEDERKCLTRLDSPAVVTAARELIGV